MASGDEPSRNSQCPVHDRELGVCMRVGDWQEGRCSLVDQIASPISPAEGTAIQLHAIHEANLAAGFSEAQSMYLLGVTMGAPVIPPGGTTEADAAT